MLEARSITCPYCWQTIDVLLDRSVPEQRYVEDCSVCCRPIVIAFSGEGAAADLEVTAESDG